MTQNWARNQELGTERVASPRSVAELQELVATSRSVGVLGAGHSFTDVINATGTLIRLDRMPRRIVVDEPAATARVDAGLTYGELARDLHAKGWALPNLPSLTHVTIGGAVSTATHGSGSRLRTLADHVQAVDYVTGDGTLKTFSDAHAPTTFPGSVVALGALGVAVNYTLALTPAFDVVQSVLVGFAVEEIEEHLDSVLGSAYSVSIFTDWSQNTNVFLKERVGGHEVTRPSWVSRAPARTAVPHVPGVSTEGMTPQLSVPGAWFERLPHVLPNADLEGGTELQSEYFVPAPLGPQALGALRRRADEFRSELLVSEVRAIRADNLWLSPAYLRDSVSLHFTWRWDPVAVNEAIRVVEEVLTPFAPRPHWGKLHHLPADYLVQQYEQVDRFAQLVREVDPKEKFRSPTVRRLLAAL